MTPQVAIFNLFAQFRREPVPTPGAGNWAYLSQLIPAVVTGGDVNQAQIFSTIPQSFIRNAQPLVSPFAGASVAGNIYQQPLQSSQNYAL
jgi:hypothetical protein